MNSLMQIMPQWSESSGNTTKKQILERVAETVSLLIISVKQEPIQSNITHTHTQTVLLLGEILVSFKHLGNS